MKNRNIDMLNGPLLKKMMSYTLPIILTGFLQLLYSAADLVVIGQFAGADAFAAVGATPALTNLFTNLFIGIANGGCICVAQYYGARDAKNVFETVHTCVLVSIIGGLFIGIVGFFFAKSALRLMGTHEDIINLSALYMKIVFLSFPFTLFYNFAAGIMRASGDAKTPFYILMLTGIVNVLLNLVFVIIFKMSVAGVALATAISAVLNAVIGAKVLTSSSDIIYIDFKKLKIYKDKFVKIINYGVPSAIQSLMFSISNVLIQTSINSFGSVAVVGGASAAGNIESFIYTAMDSVSQTSLNFASQNFGARKYDRVGKTLRLGSLMVLFVGVGMGILSLTFKVPLLKIYQPDSLDAVNAGIQRMQIVSSTYFICGLYNVIVSVLRAIGSTWPPAILCVASVCGLRILWLFTVFKAHHTLTTLYLSYPVTWTVTLIILLFMYLFRSKHYFAKNEAKYENQEGE